MSDQKFSVVRGSELGFARDGLRAQFEYGDLGIRAATDGRYHAHIVRPTGAGAPPIGRHIHDGIDFQMVYILKGSMKFLYEGEGEVTVSAGDCVLQPPRIEHTVLDWSDDLELLEITSPAGFKTEALGD